MAGKKKKNVVAKKRVISTDPDAPTKHILITPNQMKYLDELKGGDKKIMNTTIIERLIKMYKSALAAVRKRSDATGSKDPA